MRVQCLHASIILALLASCYLQSISPAPTFKSNPMVAADLDNLRSANLKFLVGRTVINSDNGEIIEYTNYNRETSDFPGGQMAPPKNTQRHIHRDAYYTRNRESSEAAILNIKADIRRMNEADADHFDDDLESDERPMQADRASSMHRTRHFRQRKRRKGCGASRYGHQQMLCPSRSTHHYDVCITSEQLCDDIVDCPGGEDENPTNCLFYKSIKEQLKHIYNTVLLLADHAAGQNSHHEL